MNDLKYTREFELIVRDLTDSGLSRIRAEKIATEWLNALVK